MERTLTIDLPGRAYPIHIAPGAIAQAPALIAERFGSATSCLLVADERVAGLYGQQVCAGLRAAGLRAELATFPPGEGSKSLATAESLWQACAAMRLDRQGLVVALGGGVCGDLAGFVAACWMRGVALVQIPTTLLSMVDSSVGGKTAVNSSFGKNLIGAFHQPSLVAIDVDVLNTMDERDYRAGLAEVVKYGVIYDADFFAWVEAHAEALRSADPTLVAEAVQRSCAIKAAYVVGDEREQGMRAHLNYGHTFGHALEGETSYQRYLHGEAVAIGMRMAAACAQHLGMLEDPSLIPRQDAVLAALGLPCTHTLGDTAELARLVDRCRLDKKVHAGVTRFILPQAIGRVATVENPDPEAVAAGFAAGCSTAGGAAT
ncbi:MAG: 3-dehydroquinate synthase [Planctomycetota bacterium]|nr:MAG: 3-dehydroquinate synthase [Planctomycetota bacterium]